MTATSKIIQQRGLYYDEIEVGAIYRHAPGGTVAEADNVSFSTLSMYSLCSPSEPHSSALLALGQPLVNSMFTLSTTAGGSVAQLTQGTIVANLGVERVTCPKPRYHGLTL